MIQSPGWMLRKRLRWRSTARSKRNSSRLRTLSCRSCTLRQVQVQVLQEDSPAVASQGVLREVLQEASPALGARMGLV